MICIISITIMRTLSLTMMIQLQELHLKNYIEKCYRVCNNEGSVG